jgi:hypothetical protein
MTRRTILAGIVIGCLASAGMFGSGYMVFGWNPGQVDEYALSEGLGNLVGRWQLSVAATILLLLVPFQFRTYLLSMAMFALPLACATIYECVKFPDSHNLLGFEIVGLPLFSGLFHLPSAVVRWIYVSLARNPTSNPLG